MTEECPVCRTQCLPREVVQLRNYWWLCFYWCVMQIKIYLIRPCKFSYIPIFLTRKRHNLSASFPECICGKKHCACMAWKCSHALLFYRTDIYHSFPSRSFDCWRSVDTHRLDCCQVWIEIHFTKRISSFLLLQEIIWSKFWIKTYLPICCSQIFNVLQTFNRKNGWMHIA